MRTAVLSALLLASAGGAVRAQEISTGPITLEAVTAAALRDNPELKAARKALEAAAQLPAQAGALPDPALTVTHMTTPVQTKAGPLDDKISLTQKFPFPGKRGLGRDAAAAEAEVARQAARAKALEIAARAARAFYDLYYVERSLEILGEQQEVLDGIARVANDKYAVGKAPQAMVFKAQVELAKLGEELLTARELRESARAALNALLNRPPAAPLGAPRAPAAAPAVPEADRLEALALEARPELLALKALEAKREKERKLALRQYFPDLMLGYEYTFIGSGTTAMSYDGRDAKGVMAGINLPLWLGRNRAAVKGKEAARDAARATLEDMTNQTRWQVRDLWAKADTAARLLALYDTTVLPQASAALEAMQAAYGADKAGFLDLLDSQRTLLDSELQQAANRAALAVALAELDRVTGTGPDGRKL